MINVSTGQFFGPFDLLLDLIKKSKYDIYEIKISDITNKYIESLKTIDIPSEETADFILIATQLLYIKTTSLINDTIDIEDEDEDFISQDELLRRLVEYQKIKSVLPKLSALEDEGFKKYTKIQDDLTKYKDTSDIIEYDIEKLKYSLESLLEILLKDKAIEIEGLLEAEEYSLEKYNSEIKLKLIKDKIISISKMLKKIDIKSEAITIFLSILELSRTNNLFIKQDEISKEIIVEINQNHDVNNLD